MELKVYNMVSATEIKKENKEKSNMLNIMNTKIKSY